MNKKQLIEKVKTVEWEWEWGRKCSVLVNYIIMKVWIKWGFNNIIIFNKNNYTEFFMDKKDLEKISKNVYKQSIKKGFSGSYEKKAKQACERFIKVSKPNPSKDLMQQYHEYIDAFINLLRFVSHIRIFNRIGEQKLREFVNSKIKKPKEQIKIFSILSATTRKNAFSDFHERMKKAYKEKQKQMIKSIVEDFKWMPVGYGDEPEWTQEDIKKQLEDFKPIREHKIDKNQIIRKLNPSKEILRLIEVIDLFVYYKDYLRRISNYCNYYSRPVFIELGKKYGLSLKEIKTLMPDEIGRIKPRKSSIMFSDHGQIHVFDYSREIENLFSFKTKEIKGTVACVGKSRGKVVIINNHDDLKKEFDNRILVSVMTTPEITPAIKKCKAIVTDEGGITCHAAIVSRELGIPCIIGTKIATKVLKDNDLVEVDAEKGVVKIIK